MIEPNQDDGPKLGDDATLIEPLHPIASSEPLAVGPFEIIRLIAQGNCTKIYEVTAPGASRRLALKLANTDSQSISRCFERIASLAASLNHPHILSCCESSRADGRPYLLMPLVDGASVSELAHRQPLPAPTEVMRIARAAASALDYAHGQDIVHGNVHPKHVLLDRTGHVWLTGFAEVSLGHPKGMIFGNPRHLAPEQFDGVETVPQTDVYALAEVVFLLLTGSFPFPKTALSELLARKLSGPVPSIGKSRPELPRSVDLALRRAMAVRPEDRFPSAGRLVDELEKGLGKSEQEHTRWWQIWR